MLVVLVATPLVAAEGGFVKKDINPLDPPVIGSCELEYPMKLRPACIGGGGIGGGGGNGGHGLGGGGLGGFGLGGSGGGVQYSYDPSPHTRAFGAGIGDNAVVSLGA